MTSSPFEEHFYPVEQTLSLSLSEHSSTKLARLNTEHCVVLHTLFPRDVRRRQPSSSNSTQLLIPTLPIHLPCSDYTITMRTTLTTTFCLTLHTGSHTHFFLSFFSNKELKNNSKVWLQCLAPVFVASLLICVISCTTCLTCISLISTISDYLISNIMVISMMMASFNGF